MAVLRFVNSIQASPAVRLDLANRAPFAMGNETSFGMPQMRRTVTSSMLRDGEHVGASAYGNREIDLVLELLTATADSGATSLQLLHRELDRPTNLLQYSPGGVTNSVFFRTFRGSPDSIRFDPDRKQVRVTLLAEPFALGTREDIPAVTVRNDPTLTNGLFADLTGIKGDVETPLFIEYADGAGGLARSGYTVGIRSGASPYPNRYTQAEAMARLFPDTTAVADSTFSGGSKVRVTFSAGEAPSTLFGRLGTFVPSATATGAESWGLYRIFVRAAQTVASDVMVLAAGPGAGTNPSVRLKQRTQPQLVDLGIIDVTDGNPTTGGYAAAEYRADIAGSLVINAARLSGSGFLDIDYAVWVPADECLGSWGAWADLSTGFNSVVGVIDGPNDAVYLASALSSAAPGRVWSESIPITGRLPRVAPGNNRLVIVESAKNPSVPTSANALTSSMTMTCRYWPRYLLVRPVGT